MPTPELTAQITVDDSTYQSVLSDGKSIAIGMNFSGGQPNHFGVPTAKSSVVVAGQFKGDTKSGGSCNVETISLTPHCNGTHTETVGHIVNQKPTVFDSLQEFLFPANLVTVSPSPARKTEETYLPPLEPGDEIITRKSLESQLKEPPLLPGLILRTKPNSSSKRVRKYDQENQPAFFSCQAIQYLVEFGIRHLLTDLPSLDRIYDDGMMSNHRLYWGIPAGSKNLAPDTDVGRTVTEIVYIPDEIPDGLYLVNLQIAPMKTDAVPSNPVLFPMQKVDS